MYEAERSTAYRVKPHLVYIRPVLIFGYLYAPLSTILVLLIFPSGNNTLLQDQITVSILHTFWIRP